MSDRYFSPWKELIDFLKLLRKKPAVSLAKFVFYKIILYVIHFVIIIVTYLALIRLLFVELGFRQIKRKYILCYYTTRYIYSGSNALIDRYFSFNLS